MALVGLTVLREGLNAVGITTISITDSALSALESRVGGDVEGYVMRTLGIAWHTEYFDIEEYEKSVNLTDYPIQAIAGLTNGTSLVAVADYHSDSPSGIITLVDSLALTGRLGNLAPYFDEGTRTVWITYQAGYTTIPAEIQSVVIGRVGRLLGGSGTSGLSSESIGSGDYSYNRLMSASGADGGFTTDDLAILHRFRTPLMFF